MSASTEVNPVIGKSIPFNVPAQVGNELAYVQDCFARGHLSGNGRYTRRCELFFERRFGFRKALMTTSCTDALEMAALLIGIQPGDEVIVPAYTFVSSANAFVLRGAKIVFADSGDRTPNIDASRLESLITERTKAVVIVHYAGMACELETIQAITQKHGLFLIEDAAQAIDASYHGQPLGSFGHLATFSFHETKNVVCGEGGMLVINDERFIRRAEIIRDKGTDRQAFIRGEVDKYTWQDIGSSFLPADYVAAYLWAQLECMEQIQATRLAIWQEYHRCLQPLAKSDAMQLPALPPGASNNAHMYYLVCKTPEDRTYLINALKAQGIHAVFHYLPLHESPFYATHHDGRPLENANHYAHGLVRLPLYYNLKLAQVRRIASVVLEACQNLPSLSQSLLTARV